MKQPVIVRNTRIGDGIPKICVPIVEKDFPSILTAARNLKSSCPDLAEWRCDHFDQAEEPEAAVRVLQALHEILEDIPILFTFRTKAEGGEKEIAAASYERLNCQVAASGLADLIDVEIFTGDDTVRSILAAAHRANVPVVASNHHFHETPAQETLLEILTKMDQMGYLKDCRDAPLPERCADPAFCHGGNGSSHCKAPHHHVHGASRHDQPPVWGSVRLCLNLRNSR